MDGFWDNPEQTKSVLKERSFISHQIEKFTALEKDLEDSQILLELGEEESDQESIKEVGELIKGLDKRLKKLSMELILSGQDDANNAIISINAGAGGTEAQDWAEMLFRMYLRYVEQKGFESEIIDYQPGDEAGMKSTTFTVSGAYAYGYLKTETGVHRLVRISPFNASGKRHTSFASVFVYPELDSEIVVDVEDKDIRVDVFRASGAGGQHVNKTSSAVRLTHLPSALSCNASRKNLSIETRILQ
jgi:peptide chain release factor 2